MKKEIAVIIFPILKVKVLFAVLFFEFDQQSKNCET